MGMNFKVMFSNGVSIKLMNLPDNTTLDDLKAQLAEKSGLSPEEQHIMTGFPPKLIEGNGNETLQELNIRSGSMLTLKEPLLSGELTGKKKKTVFVRRDIPADNSCLFNAIAYALGKGKQGHAHEMRQQIKDTILSDPNTYSSVFLGRDVSEYCGWIMQPASWGGEIELSILSTYFKIEMVVFDVTSMARLCYGEDQGFTQRLFLLYDGVHYDLIVESPYKGAPESSDMKLFSINDFPKVEQASEVAVEAHQKHEFTDLSKFTIRCAECHQNFAGQSQAQAHAQEFGHYDFRELR